MRLDVMWPNARNHTKQTIRSYARLRVKTSRSRTAIVKEFSYV